MSGNLILIVTDGDDDLAIYIADLFPETERTLAAYHATEYL